MERCLLQGKDLPTKFWDETVYCANYLLNRISIRETSQVNPVEKWCGKKYSIYHLKMFGCVSLQHIPDDYRKKFDAKTHGCIMMGYSKQWKAYQLFDPIKQQIIIMRNVIFDKKASGIVLLKSPFGPSYSNSFNIVEDIRLTVSPMCTSTSLSTSILESTSSQRTLTKTVTSLDHSSNGNGISLNPYLPWWAIEMIEATNADVGDISRSRQTRNHK